MHRNRPGHQKKRESAKNSSKVHIDQHFPKELATCEPFVLSSTAPTSPDLSDKPIGKPAPTPKELRSNASKIKLALRGSHSDYPCSDNTGSGGAPAHVSHGRVGGIEASHQSSLQSHRFGPSFQGDGGDTGLDTEILHNVGLCPKKQRATGIKRPRDATLLDDDRRSENFSIESGRGDHCFKGKIIADDKDRKHRGETSTVVAAHSMFMSPETACDKDGLALVSEDTKAVEMAAFAVGGIFRARTRKSSKPKRLSGRQVGLVADKTSTLAKEPPSLSRPLLQVERSPKDHPDTPVVNRHTKQKDSDSFTRQTQEDDDACMEHGNQTENNRKNDPNTLDTNKSNIQISSTTVVGNTGSNNKTIPRDSGDIHNNGESRQSGNTSTSDSHDRSRGIYCSSAGSGNGSDIGENDNNGRTCSSRANTLNTSKSPKTGYSSNMRRRSTRRLTSDCLKSLGGQSSSGTIFKNKSGRDDHSSKNDEKTLQRELKSVSKTHEPAGAAISMENLPQDFSHTGMTDEEASGFQNTDTISMEDVNRCSPLDIKVDKTRSEISQRENGHDKDCISRSLKRKLDNEAGRGLVEKSSMGQSLEQSKVKDEPMFTERLKAVLRQYERPEKTKNHFKSEDKPMQYFDPIEDKPKILDGCMGTETMSHVGSTPEDCLEWKFDPDKREEATVDSDNEKLKLRSDPPIHEALKQVLCEQKDGCPSGTSSPDVSHIKQECLQEYDVEHWCDLGPSAHQFGASNDSNDNKDVDVEDLDYRATKYDDDEEDSASPSHPSGRRVFDFDAFKTYRGTSLSPHQQNLLSSGHSSAFHRPASISSMEPHHTSNASYSFTPGPYVTSIAYRGLHPDVHGSEPRCEYPTANMGAMPRPFPPAACTTATSNNGAPHLFTSMNSNYADDISARSLASNEYIERMHYPPVPLYAGGLLHIPPSSLSERMPHSPMLVYQQSAYGMQPVPYVAMVPGAVNWPHLQRIPQHPQQSIPSAPIYPQDLFRNSETKDVFTRAGCGVSPERRDHPTSPRVHNTTPAPRAYASTLAASTPGHEQGMINAVNIGTGPAVMGFLARKPTSATLRRSSTLRVSKHGEDFIDPTRMKFGHDDEEGSEEDELVRLASTKGDTSDEEWRPGMDGEAMHGNEDYGDEDSNDDADNLSDKRGHARNPTTGKTSRKKVKKGDLSTGFIGKQKQCPTCGKLCNGDYLLRRHQMSHSEHRPHVCPHCGKGFKQKAHLQGHVKSVHSKPDRIAETVRGRDSKIPAAKGSEDKPLLFKCRGFTETVDKDATGVETMADKEPALLEKATPEMRAGNIDAEALDRGGTKVGRPKRPFKERDFSCRICGKTFKTAYRLKRHEQSHTDVRPYACHVCGKRFKQSGHRNEHEANHERHGVRFLCNRCGVVFRCRSSFNNHMRAHGQEQRRVEQAVAAAAFTGDHDDPEMSGGNRAIYLPLAHTGDMVGTAYDCPYCVEKFATAQALNNHLETHVEISQRRHVQPYRCDVCRRTFTYRHNLVKHSLMHRAPEKFADYHKEKIEAHVASGKPSFKCTHCSKIFIRKETLAKHSKIHTGARPYKCNICSQCFSQNIHLKVHMRKHTGSRPFQCRECGKGFIDSTALAKHIENEACTSDNYMYNCKICDKRHYYLGSIKQHMRREHGVVDEDLDAHILRTERTVSRSKGGSMNCESSQDGAASTSDNGPHLCRICSRLFKEKCNLLRHIKRAHEQLVTLMSDDIDSRANEDVDSAAVSSVVSSEIASDSCGPQDADLDTEASLRQSARQRYRSCHFSRDGCQHSEEARNVQDAVVAGLSRQVEKSTTDEREKSMNETITASHKDKILGGNIIIPNSDDQPVLSVHAKNSGACPGLVKLKLGAEGSCDLLEGFSYTKLDVENQLAGTRSNKAGSVDEPRPGEKLGQTDGPRSVSSPCESFLYNIGLTASSKGRQSVTMAASRRQSELSDDVFAESKSPPEEGNEKLSKCDGDEAGRMDTTGATDSISVLELAASHNSPPAIFTGESFVIDLNKLEESRAHENHSSSSYKYLRRTKESPETGARCRAVPEDDAQEFHTQPPALSLPNRCTVVTLEEHLLIQPLATAKFSRSSSVDLSHSNDVGEPAAGGESCNAVLGNSPPDKRQVSHRKMLPLDLSQSHLKSRPLPVPGVKVDAIKRTLPIRCSSPCGSMATSLPGVEGARISPKTSQSTPTKDCYNQKMLRQPPSSQNLSTQCAQGCHQQDPPCFQQPHFSPASRFPPSLSTAPTLTAKPVASPSTETAVASSGAALSLSTDASHTQSQSEDRHTTFTDTQPSQSTASHLKDCTEPTQSSKCVPSSNAMNLTRSAPGSEHVTVCEAAETTKPSPRSTSVTRLHATGSTKLTMSSTLVPNPEVSDLANFMSGSNGVSNPDGLDLKKAEPSSGSKHTASPDPTHSTCRSNCMPSVDLEVSSNSSAKVKCAPHPELATPTLISEPRPNISPTSNTLSRPKIPAQNTTESSVNVPSGRSTSQPPIATSPAQTPPTKQVSPWPTSVPRKTPTSSWRRVSSDEDSPTKSELTTFAHLLSATQTTQLSHKAASGKELYCDIKQWLRDIGSLNTEPRKKRLRRVGADSNGQFLDGETRASVKVARADLGGGQACFTTSVQSPVRIEHFRESHKPNASRSFTVRASSCEGVNKQGVQTAKQKFYTVKIVSSASSLKNGGSKSNTLCVLKGNGNIGEGNRENVGKSAGNSIINSTTSGPNSSSSWGGTGSDVVDAATRLDRSKALGDVVTGSHRPMYSLTLENGKMFPNSSTSRHEAHGHTTHATVYSGSAVSTTPAPTPIDTTALDARPQKDVTKPMAGLEGRGAVYRVSVRENRPTLATTSSRSIPALTSVHGSKASDLYPAILGLTGAAIVATDSGTPISHDQNDQGSKMRDDLATTTSIVTTDNSDRDHDAPCSSSSTSLLSCDSDNRQPHYTQATSAERGLNPLQPPLSALRLGLPKATGFVALATTSPPPPPPPPPPPSSSSSSSSPPSSSPSSISPSTSSSHTTTATTIQSLASSLPPLSEPTTVKLSYVFSCTQCGKTFSARHRLKRHELTHTNFRPYSCSQCGRAFRQKVHLSDHMKRHAGDRPFACGGCGRRFVLKNEMNQHMKHYCYGVRKASPRAAGSGSQGEVFTFQAASAVESVDCSRPKHSFHISNGSITLRIVESGTGPLYDAGQPVTASVSATETDGSKVTAAEQPGGQPL